VLRSSGFEDLEHRMEAKASIRPDTKLSNIARYVEEAGRHQFNAAVPCARITRTQFRVPEIGRVGFDAQQWVVRALAAITRIVADLGILLTSENCDHTAIEIKDQAGSVVRHVDEILQQPVIHAVHLSQERATSLEQKTAQRLRIGEARQTSQISKDAVGT
jgi:hypothetical protein